MSTPDKLPVVDLQMTKQQADRLAWTALVFAALAIVANGVAGFGFLPVWAMQLSSGLAAIFTGLSWLFSRKAPSSEARSQEQQPSENPTETEHANEEN